MSENEKVSRPIFPKCKEQIILKDTLIENYEDVLLFIDAFGINPIYMKDESETVRFRTNNVIRYLIDFHREKTENTKDVGLNLIYDKAYKEGYTLRDMVELYIGMGYSLGGFEEIFRDAMDKILNVQRDYHTGKEIRRDGANEKSKKLIDGPILEIQ